MVCEVLKIQLNVMLFAAGYPSLFLRNKEKMASCVVMFGKEKMVACKR